MDFLFKLSEQHSQKVLNALIKEPYGEVADVIETIQKQAIEQRNASNEKTVDRYTPEIMECGLNE